MIRRSPTRIELKLEDLNDFEYIQKFEKKKNPSGNVLGSAADAQKMVRHERIGLGFRPIRASSNVGPNGSFASATAVTSGIGGGASISDIGVPVTPNNDNSGREGGLNLIDNSSEEMGMLNLTVNEDTGPVNNTNTSNMSLDESL